MSESQYYRDRYDASQLEKLSHPVMEQIIASLKSEGVFTDAYAVKTRIKDETKLLEKVKRKRSLEGRTDYRLSDITDVIGLRIVSLFREDMIDLFRKSVKLISHDSSINPNPFQKASFEEVIIYSPYEHDALTASIKLMSSSIIPDGVSVKSQISSEGYSSIHLVCRTTERLEVSGEEISIPVEVQIRTVFEDAWGEIDHKFRYSGAEGKSGLEVSNPLRVAENLKILKKFSDSCSLYADEIKRDAIQQITSSYAGFDIYPVDTNESINEKLVEIQSRQEDIEKYRELREILNKYSRDKLSTSRTLQLVSAADDFLDLAKFISKELAVPESVDFIKFHFTMNAALCLIATYDEKHLRIALDLYKSCLAVDEKNPMVKLRLAQTLVALGMIDESIKYFEILADSVVGTGSVYVHDKEVRHIEKHMPYMFGYVLWRKYKENSEKETIIRAIEVSQKYNYESDESIRNKYRNNILYYLYELALLTVGDKSKPDANYVKKIRELILLIENQNSNLDENIDVLDSLARAYFVIEEYEESLKYCNLLLDLAFGIKPSETDFSSEWELVQEIHELKYKISQIT
jgi:ppGpp synthetase/RelA/SpoT-type nucleotidyltranferase